MALKSKYLNKDKEHKFDFQSRLGYSIQGKRGGSPQVKDDIGKVVTYIDNPNGCTLGNAICVDAFKGSGESYERRDKCEVRIINNGDVVFDGDFCMLVEKLHTTSGRTYEIEPIE